MIVEIVVRRTAAALAFYGACCSALASVLKFLTKAQATAATTAMQSLSVGVFLFARLPQVRCSVAS